jgi:hypothetical protein
MLVDWKAPALSNGGRGFPICLQPLRPSGLPNVSDIRHGLTE